MDRSPRPSLQEDDQQPVHLRSLIPGSAVLCRTTGTVNQKVLPCPACSRRRSRRPSARPAASRSPAQAGAAVAPGRRAVGLRERLEQARLGFVGRCRCRCRGPRSAPSTCRRSSSSTSVARTTTSPALGELDGVADQVEQHLAQPAGIAAAARSGPPAATDVTQLELLCRRPVQRPDPPTSSTSLRGRRSRPVSSVELAGLDLGEVEDVVDDRQQRLGAGSGWSGRSRAAPSSAACRSSSSVMPITPFIGVRISWLMLARNSLFRREASSAPSRARTRSLIRSITSTTPPTTPGLTYQDVMAHRTELMLPSLRSIRSSGFASVSPASTR